MYKQMVYIGDKCYETLPRQRSYIHAELQPPKSFVWVCPTCGTAWARAKVENRAYFVLTRPCESHRDPLLPSLVVSGSLWLGGEDEFNESLSHELLLREFNLLYNFLRSSKDEQRSEDHYSPA